MKVDRMLRVIAALKASQTFKMDQYATDADGEETGHLSDLSCGTPCCVAGHAAALALAEEFGIAPDGSDDIHSYARRWLGMSDWNASRIFLNEAGFYSDEDTLDLPASVVIPRLERFVAELKQRKPKQASLFASAKP